MNHSIYQSFEIWDDDNETKIKISEDLDDFGCVVISSDGADPIYFTPEIAILVAEALIKVAKTIQEKNKK
jgi:hypothetical protein